MLDRLLRFSQLDEVCGIRSRATLSRYQRDLGFPRPIQISRRNVAWRERDIAAWLKKRSADTGSLGSRDHV